LSVVADDVNESVKVAIVSAIGVLGYDFAFAVISDAWRIRARVECGSRGCDENE
jgi:hypothetical protein